MENKTHILRILLCALIFSAIPAFGSMVIEFEKVWEENDPVKIRQHKIATLLQQAEEDLAADRLTKPKGSSAYDRYQQVLQLEPDNIKAKSGLSRLAKRYKQLAAQATTRGDHSKARDYQNLAEQLSLEQTSSSKTAHASHGKTYTDPTTGMEFVQITAGCFQMGSPASEKDRQDDEGPVHKVCVDSFYMGKYEVTVDQFRQFIKASGNRTDAEKEGWSYVFKKGKWEKEQGVDWHNDYQGDRAADNLPVIYVSWNDAQAYIKWLNKKQRKSYRLATEAEFEYANRAGRTGRYWWGNGSPQRKVANVTGEETNPAVANQHWGTKFDGYNDGHWGPSPVGSFAANPFGLHDTTGNVWEWCSDWYGKDYYKNSPRNNPQGTSSGSYRVDRGGSWISNPRVARAAYRGRSGAGFRSNYLGFRLVFPAGH